MTITPFLDLVAEAEDYQAKIEVEIDDATVGAALTESVAINARTGKMLADAMYWQDDAVKSNILKDLMEFIALPPLTLNKFVSAYCKDQNHLVKWLERLNAASDKKAKACITIISRLKAEMVNAGRGGI